MDKKRGPFESLGKKLDSFVGDALDFLSPNDSEENSTKHNNQSPELIVVKTFLQGLGNDVELCVAGSDFTYKDILLWAREHIEGNELYLIRYYDENSKNTLVCVCFAQNGQPLIRPQHAKICYAFKELPESLSNIFGTKTMFVQPIKK